MRVLRGLTHRARSPLGGLCRPLAAALVEWQAGHHSLIGRLVLQRGLHGHSRDAHDLDPALLRLLLAACARRAHPDATVAQRHWSDGGALLGYRRGQRPTVTGRGGVTTSW